MESIAIIGTGIAGMGCDPTFCIKDLTSSFMNRITTWEAIPIRVYVEEDDKQIPIDTGFIVFNNQTYPNLVKLLPNSLVWK